MHITPEMFDSARKWFCGTLSEYGIADEDLASVQIRAAGNEFHLDFSDTPNQRECTIPLFTAEAIAGIASGDTKVCRRTADIIEHFLNRRPPGKPKPAGFE